METSCHVTLVSLAGKYHAPAPRITLPPSYLRPSSESSPWPRWPIRIGDATHGAAPRFGRDCVAGLIRCRTLTPMRCRRYRCHPSQCGFTADEAPFQSDPFHCRCRRPCRWPRRLPNTRLAANGRRTVRPTAKPPQATPDSAGSQRKRPPAGSGDLRLQIGALPSCDVRVSSRLMRTSRRAR